MKFEIDDQRKDYLKHKCSHSFERFLTILKWIIFSVLTGIVVGLVSAAFAFCMRTATEYRLEHSYMLYFLPVGAIVIVFLYRMILKQRDGGTNVVLAAISSGEKLPFRMAPLIFVSSIITHAVGGSAGREGAALQMGGAIGNGIGRAFNFNQHDKNTMIMCGMSAAFSALFGTPMAAAIFSMEVISVGIMHYAALVPCVISSLIARAIADYFGVKALGYEILSVPGFGVLNAIRISIFAVLCGLVSMLFCFIMHSTGALMNKYLKNLYLRAFLGGSTVLVLTMLVGNQTYNGTGASIIESCFRNDTIISPWVFLLKMIFTALTLSCCYKGGEIVPTLFIGSTFGYFFGSMIGFSPTLCAAVGMGALFCGVTNCPITSLLICFELFGIEAMPYYLLAIAFAYLVSGYTGLYRSQKIIYSKYKSNYINKQVG